MIAAVRKENSAAEPRASRPAAAIWVTVLFCVAAAGAIGAVAFQQLPVRLTLMGLTAGLTIFLVFRLNRERARSISAMRDSDRLGEIGRVANLTGESELDFGLLAGKIAALVPFDMLVVRQVLHEAGASVDSAVWRPGRELPVSPVRRPLQASLVAASISSGAPLAVTEMEVERVVREVPQLEETGVRSGLLVPVRWDGVTLSVLIFTSSSRGRYGGSETLLAARVADQLAGAMSRSRLHAKLVRQLQERAAVEGVGRVVSASLEPERVYERIETELRRLVAFDRIVVTVLQAGGETMRDVYVGGITVPGREKGRIEPVRGTMTAEVTASRRHLLLDAADPEETAERLPWLRPHLERGFRSFLSVPLIANDRAIGALHLRTMRPGSYSAGDEALVEEVGRHVAAAVANAELHDRLEREAEERAAMAEIGRIISSTFEIADVYPKFAEQAANLVPLDRITVSLLDDQPGWMTVAYVAGAPVDGYHAGQRFKVSSTPLQAAIASERPAVAEEAGLRAQANRYPVSAAMIEHGMRSMLIAPLVWQSRVVGTLNIWSRAPGAYGAREIALAEQIGAQVAGAIAASQMHARARHEAEIRTALAAISVVASSDLDLDSVFKRVEAEITKLLEHDRFAVYLLEPDGLRVAYASGVQIKGLEAGTLFPFSLSAGRQDPPLGGRVSESNYCSLLEPSGLQAWLLAPLGTAGGRPLGYINIRSLKTDLYRQKDLALFELAARQVTPAIQNAISHRQALKLAEERERAARLESEAVEVDRVDKAKSEFLTNVSHELRTPLTSVLAFATLLRRNKDANLNTKQLGQLEVIERNGRRLAVLIDDLINLSQLETGRFRLSLVPFDASDVLSEVADGFQPILAQRRQRFAVAMPDGPAMVHGDRVRIIQALSNVVGNAMQFSPEDSEIRLSAVATGGTLVIKVADDGDGMTSEDKKKLFSLFFRADNEVTKSSPGAGTGLFMAQAILRLHEGDISIESEPGRGTTVTLSLPLAPSAAAEIQKEAA